MIQCQYLPNLPRINAIPPPMLHKNAQPKNQPQSIHIISHPPTQTSKVASSTHTPDTPCKHPRYTQQAPSQHINTKQIRQHPEAKRKRKRKEVRRNRHRGWHTTKPGQTKPELDIRIPIPIQREKRHDGTDWSDGVILHEGYARIGLADYAVGEEKAIIQIQHEWEEYHPHVFFFFFFFLGFCGILLVGIYIPFLVYTLDM